MEKTTIDHDEIKSWAQTYKGQPQIIVSPQAGAEKPGVRIKFPGDRDAIMFGRARTIRDISWDRFFKLLESLDLALVYTPQANENNLADAYKFIPRAAL